MNNQKTREQYEQEIKMLREVNESLLDGHKPLALHYVALRLNQIERDHRESFRKIYRRLDDLDTKIQGMVVDMASQKKQGLGRYEELRARLDDASFVVKEMRREIQQESAKS